MLKGPKGNREREAGDKSTYVFLPFGTMRSFPSDRQSHDGRTAIQSSNSIILFWTTTKNSFTRPALFLRQVLLLNY